MYTNRSWAKKVRDPRALRRDRLKAVSGARRDQLLARGVRKEISQKIPNKLSSKKV